MDRTTQIDDLNQLYMKLQKQIHKTEMKILYAMVTQTVAVIGVLIIELRLLFELQSSGIGLP